MIKVLLVCGGRSSEHEISRISCKSVYDKLDRNRYEISLVGIDKEGIWHLLPRGCDPSADDWLKGAKPVSGVFDLIKSHDVAFPVLHGKYGEDGTIQGLFELCNVPYVGDKVLCHAMCMDKVYTKKILSCAGIPQVESLFILKRYDGKLVLMEDDFRESKDWAGAVKERIGFPCFIKASRQGSSVGCFKCENEADLEETVRKASEYDSHILVEKFVNCLELECGALGNDDIIISPVGAIIPHGEFYTYESKYHDAKSLTVIPADIPGETTKLVRSLAERAFKAINGRGFARIDFFLDKDSGEVYLNEINTIPGFTSISMYPKLMEAAGISYTKLLDMLIDFGIEAGRE